MSKGLLARAAGRTDHRPREGGGVRRHLRGNQQHDLDQSRLGLRQRLPEPRPHAARDRAGGPRLRACRPTDILTYNVRNSRGQLVPLSSFATVNWSVGPAQIVGFNYYPSVRISGSAKPGYTSGDAIDEMERLAAQLPRGFGFEWTGQSLQEKQSGSQAPLLLALSALLVFLVLAALYESWTIPLAVLLTVPLGILGAVIAAMLRGLPNDVYFTVGSDHDHRPGGQGRHPDHRIRQGAARAGQAVCKTPRSKPASCASGRS